MEANKDKKIPVITDEKKHQLLLRISNNLWQSLQNWADEEFRSINGQIEYILSEAVKKKRKTEE